MSGFKVNFSVNNQLATPSMHAAALANRPAAGQPGRVFIDTDNPSTGIYRDTGTVWVQIAETATSDVDTLQNVTDNGNTTDNTLILTYDSLFNGSNQIEFFDVGTTAVRYGINKVGTGNRLTIQGNSPLSTFDMGLMIDAPNNTLRTYFGSSFETKGISLDFTNNIYRLGNVTGTAGNQGIYINSIGNVGLGTTSVSSLGSNVTTFDIVGKNPVFTGGLFLRSSDNSVRGYILDSSGGTGLTIATETNQNITFVTNASEKIRLFANGNFGIGTTTDAGYKLDVTGTARFTGNVGIGMGSGANALQVRGNFYADDGNGYYGVINATNGGWFISNQGNSAARISSTFTYFLSNTAIGTSTDAASAILSATSTTKGFLPPRMTTAQINAITSPAEGLIAYNTTISHLCVYQSGAWVRINHSPM
jgi:hypothetical protein